MRTCVSVCEYWPRACVQLLRLSYIPRPCLRRRCLCVWLDTKSVHPWTGCAHRLERRAEQCSAWRNRHHNCAPYCAAALLEHTCPHLIGSPTQKFAQPVRFDICPAMDSDNFFDAKSCDEQDEKLFDLDLSQTPDFLVSHMNMSRRATKPVSLGISSSCLLRSSHGGMRMFVWVRCTFDRW